MCACYRTRILTWCVDTIQTFYSHNAKNSHPVIYFPQSFQKKKKTYFVQCRTDTKRPISWFGKIDFPPQSFEVINLRYILYPLKFPFPFFFFKCNTKRVFQTNTSMSTISVLIVRYCNFDCSEIHEKGVSSELSTGVTPSYFIIYM